jgi:hypothetical protein
VTDAYANVGGTNNHRNPSVRCRANAGSGARRGRQGSGERGRWIDRQQDWGPRCLVEIEV